MQELWRVLCFGPAAQLGLEAPGLELGSRRWLLFDPQRRWRPADDALGPKAANQPFATAELTGQVLACGLDPQLWRG